jgi:alginate O-acetyltransferase complex protein AlgJ
MARKIDMPTPANLDMAAYSANPVLANRERPKFKRPASAIALEKITFGGNVTDVKNALDAIPLTAAEKSAPLAWRPLVKKLWEVVKERRFQTITAAINGYKWADSSVYQPYQEIACAYVRGEGDSVEFWVKIEFSPFADFVAEATDDDRDGAKELYGRLSLAGVALDTLKKAVAWIHSDYCKRVLTKEEMNDWATDLASYWYPTRNTDMVDMTGFSVWPNAQTEKSAARTMAGGTVKDPFAVIRGKPFSPDKPIYNVFVTGEPPSKPAASAVTTVPADSATHVADSGVSANFTGNTKRLHSELKQYGAYDTWAKQNASFLDGLRKFLTAIPAQQMAFAGKDSWLFFRKSADYIFSGDLASQAVDKNPIPHLVSLKEHLNKRGVNLLFVPVPGKEEVYFEKLPAGIPSPKIPYVNPYGRKFVGDLQVAGVEVVDLLPFFLAEKSRDATSREPLYQEHDTHWTSRGLAIAAEAIAQHIKEYGWYGAVEKTTFTTKDTTCSRLGDLVEKLPEAEQAAYEPVTVPAQRVFLPDGKPYAGGAASPIMLIGDSFTGVFELIDCKSAGIGAHIAQKSCISVEIVTSWGGGPLVRKKALQPREKYLGSKRLVIYMMAARDLYNYAMGWEEFPEKKN